MARSRRMNKWPFYLGLAGAALMFPMALFAVLHALEVSFAGLPKGEPNLVQTIITIIVASLPVVTGIVGALQYRRSAILSAVLLFISAVFAFSAWWGGAWNGKTIEPNLFSISLLALICFVVGGIISIMQRNKA